jgi:hypothetical protein
MAIAITSDLVQDVLKAADPRRAERAHAKLAGSGATEFAALVEKPETNRVRDLRNDPVLDVVRAADPSRLEAGARKLVAASDDPKTKAYAELEGFTLGQMMATLLPKSEEGVYGEGTAGGIWRSMLADELGSSLAASGGVGIASLLAGEPKGGLAPAPGWPYFNFSPRHGLPV